jgi:hypothetical protein
MAMQYNSRRLQYYSLLCNEWIQTRERRLVRLHHCHRTRQMNLGRLGSEPASLKIRNEWLDSLRNAV